MLLPAGVSRNLLVRFVGDQIDETPQLASMLQTSTVATSSTSSSLDLTVRNLPGDHVRPLRQAFRDLPPELAQVATQAVSQGSDLLRGLSQMATQAGLPQVRATHSSADRPAECSAGAVCVLQPCMKQAGPDCLHGCVCWHSVCRSKQVACLDCRQQSPSMPSQKV